MQAIVSLLEASVYSRIEAMWRILELKCGLKGIKATPFPHFSWHVAEDYTTGPVAAMLKEAADRSKPFTVMTSGLGIFTGQEPVIYVLIAKDERLLRFHKAIWKQARKVSLGPSHYYSPDAWVPHITLAHSDVDQNALVCAIEELAFRPFNWEVRIDNLALVGQAGEEIGQLKFRFDFPEDDLHIHTTPAT